MKKDKCLDCGGRGHISCVGPDGKQYFVDPKGRPRSRKTVKRYDSKPIGQWYIGIEFYNGVLIGPKAKPFATKRQALQAARIAKATHGVPFSAVRYE